MDPTTSIRKHANELKVHKKTVKTETEQDSSPDRNLLDYTICGVLENKIDATSYLNTGLLKNAIEGEWNKMSGEFILKVCKSFRKRVDTITEKNDGRIK